MRNSIRLLIIVLILPINFIWSKDNANPTSDYQREKTISLAINPLKPFLGLINLEFEYQLSPQISVHIFVEYLFKESDHPDFVLYMGPRYYYSRYSNVSGLYSGFNLGYFHFKGNIKKSTLTIGGESGYKILVNDLFYILPRGLITYPIRTPKVLPGFECLGGINP